MVKKNRTVIRKTIDLIVRLLGNLNLPFREHREDESSLDKGVFKKFLPHVAKSDSLIQSHLDNSAGNITAQFFFHTPKCLAFVLFEIVFSKFKQEQKN